MLQFLVINWNVSWVWIVFQDNTNSSATIIVLVGSSEISRKYTHPDWNASVPNISCLIIISMAELGILLSGADLCKKFVCLVEVISFVL